VDERRFLFVVGSGRKDGNSETLARLAARQLPDDVGQRWLRLGDLEMPPFRDSQRKDDPVPEPDGTGRLLLDATLAATDLVLVTPLYWYSLSSSVKLYLDYWASWERLPGLDFKHRMSGKTLWGVTVMADDDLSVAEPLLRVLGLTAGYLDARFAGALLGTGSWPGDVLKDRPALDRAQTFFASLRRLGVQRHRTVLTPLVVQQGHLVDTGFEQRPPVLPQPALGVPLARENRLLQGRVLHHGPVTLLVPPRPGHHRAPSLVNVNTREATLANRGTPVTCSTKLRHVITGNFPCAEPVNPEDDHGGRNSERERTCPIVQPSRAKSAQGKGPGLGGAGFSGTGSAAEKDGPDGLTAANDGAPAPDIAQRVHHAQAAAGLVRTGSLTQHGGVVARVEHGAHHLTGSAHQPQAWDLTAVIGRRVGDRVGDELADNHLGVVGQAR
jgi:multimeric flavodoxin WrbA